MLHWPTGLTLSTSLHKEKKRFKQIKFKERILKENIDLPAVKLFKISFKRHLTKTVYNLGEEHQILMCSL